MSKNLAADAGQKAPQPGRVQRPIDLDHLDAQTLGDPGLKDEVLRLYSDMSAVYLQRIEDSVSVEMLIEHLHTLKSAAAGIGAWAVRDLTRVAGDELRAGKPVNPERIQDIAVAVGECRAFIAGMLRSEDA